MGVRLIVAAPQPGYASRLALYLKEREPELSIGAFTHADTLKSDLRDRGGPDILVVHQAMLADVRTVATGHARVIVLVEGTQAEQYEGFPAIPQYQSLPRLASEIRRLTAAGEAARADGTALWTVCSAGGGAGKTTLALNLARQASERGYSVMYLNLEALDATNLLLESEEPDALTRLLYELSAHPQAAAARIGRLGARRSAIGASYMDTAASPAELLSMTPERLELLLGALRSHGGFDLIVADADGGFGEWQQRLLELSDRLLWIGADDAQLLRKTERLLREWAGRLGELSAKSTFVLNKTAGEPEDDLWHPPGGERWLTLPYIPQWKRAREMGVLVTSAAFSGGVDRLLDKLGYPGAGEETDRSLTDRGGGGSGSVYSPPSRRRTDDQLRERPAAAVGRYS
ncbi:nucleotide-binding protein [Cohnella sp. 56]|uniref:nucleotide-binding protein n=1 Tax=Cohnella sp. 56 TaxID=3113722 RepID=UPI0030E85617